MHCAVCIMGVAVCSACSMGDCYCTYESSPTAVVRHLCLQICLIMDEVDGMSGGDRGGVSELIQSIHRSKVPIICICNDKYNQKLRSLRNHTLELDYR